MKIRIIGCGSMGSAIAKNLAENGQEIILYDRNVNRAEMLAGEIRGKFCHSPLEGDTSDNILLLAVKPHHFQEVAQEVSGYEGSLVVSIITGVSIAQLKEHFRNCSILRTMPNVVVRYGDGIVALAEDPDLGPLKKQIEETFSSLGMLYWMPEELFDGITALTGSGPAFVITMIEAMVDAAIAMGFPAEMGYELVKKMVEGSLTLLYESTERPGEIEWRLASPKGTTIAGLRMLEAKGLRSGIIETFLAAYQKSQELGKR